MPTASELELLNAIKDLERKLVHLRVENAVFYRFLEKSDPQAIREMEGQLARQRRSPRESRVGSKRVSISHGGRHSAMSFSGGKEVGSTISLRTSESHRFSSTRASSTRRFGSSSKSTTRRSSLFSASGFSVTSSIFAIAEKPKEKINFNQKSDLVARELEEEEERFEEAKKKADIFRTKINAKLEELILRKEDLEASIIQFEKFKETSVPMNIQKFIRFMEDWSKKSRITADKYRLRFSSLKIQYQTKQAQLIQKQELGHLEEIDFDYVRFENANLAKKSDQKFNLFLELKKMSASGNLLLVENKKVLQDKIDKKHLIEKTIKEIELDIAKSDEELLRLYKEVTAVRNKYEKVKYRAEHYSAPGVLEYIRMKHELGQIIKEVSVWEKRKLARERVLDCEIRKMKKIMHTNKVYPCWFDTVSL